MLTALRRSLTQFATDPRLWLVLFLSALLSLVCFAGVWWGAAHGIHRVALRWPGYAGWLDYADGVLGLVTALLLFPVTFVLVAGLFQEGVADAVEARYYPDLPPADGAPLLSSILSSLRFFALAAAVNLFALPIYLILMWLAGSGVLFLLAVNGMLAGREYYEIVAGRRMTRAQMNSTRRRHRGSLFAAGMVIAALGLVPVVNLLAPVLGVAFMVHIYHLGAGRSPRQAMS